MISKRGGRRIVHIPLPRSRSRRGPDIAGAWHGWSVYIPVDGFFFPDREAIYRVEATFHQRRRRIRMEERLSQFFDIDGRPLHHVEPRTITGYGELSDEAELAVWFSVSGSSVRGVLLAQVEHDGTEIHGTLAVRPRASARPVAVKLMLRPVSETRPTLDEIGIDRIRRISPY